MTCIRTGMWAYLSEYGTYAYGDAHRYDFLSRDCDCSVYLFRVVRTTPVPPEYIHFRIHAIADWWDRAPQTPYNPSTIISHSVTDYGYEGIPNKDYIYAP